MSERVKILGWGNQGRVALHADGRFSAPPPQDADQDVMGAGDGLYRMAAIIDDQVRNPFEEGRVSQERVGLALRWIGGVLGRAAAEGLGMSLSQLSQLHASAGVVILSLAESQHGRASERAKDLMAEAMALYFDLLSREGDPVLQEHLAINLDWIIPSLPEELARRAREEMNTRLPLWPPYDAWFTDGASTLNVDWKCGAEFLDGWLRRLEGEGFKVVDRGGPYSDAILTHTFTHQGRRTDIRMALGPERDNVFRHMDDPEIHVIGYDGHSDWGRRIPRSLEHAPAQTGEKAILYLLCCGKQILQKVRDIYPRAHVVTTFNSARFTSDFTYSEDFTAFIHILKGFAARQSWAEIRGRVNADWYNNPEKNYVFPGEALAMARILDQDHDGQADVFDRLMDFNTFAVEADTRAEFEPRRPERGPRETVGSALHLGVQVFHTLAHFNELLEPFTTLLRVFSGGWFDPEEALREGEVDFGPVRVRVRVGQEGAEYEARGSILHAHASEEAWRALITACLATTVMNREIRFSHLPRHHGPATALLMVAHGLEVDDAPGREDPVWQGVLRLLQLPAVDRYAFASVKKLDPHWYSGSRRSLKSLDAALDADDIQALAAWVGRAG